MCPLVDIVKPHDVPLVALELRPIDNAHAHASFVPRHIARWFRSRSWWSLGIRLLADGFLGRRSADALPPRPLAIGLVGCASLFKYFSFFKTYADLGKHWRIIYNIHIDNLALGNKPASVKQLFREIKLNKT